MGRVARPGLGSGSCGMGGEGRVAEPVLGSGFGEIGGEGSADGRSGARSDRCGAAVSKSGERRADPEDGLEDRTDWVSACSTSGEGCA